MSAGHPDPEGRRRSPDLIWSYACSPKQSRSDTKTEAGKRTITIPAVVLPDVRMHLELFAEKEPQGLLFVGEKGAPFRRTSFGRIWRKARAKAGMPGFRFYDLRHTGNTMAAATGASLKELMARMGHASVRAALIYQHATSERDKKIADSMDAQITQRLGRGMPPPAEAQGTPGVRDPEIGPDIKEAPGR